MDNPYYEYWLKNLKKTFTLIRKLLMMAILIFFQVENLKLTKEILHNKKIMGSINKCINSSFYNYSAR